MQQTSLFKEIRRHNALSLRAEINSPQRLLDVLALDDALWTATGVNIASLAFDKTFLTYLDADGNKRILCGEARQAIRLLQNCLTSLELVFDHEASVSLGQLRDDTPEGRSARLACEHILSTLGACGQLQICQDFGPDSRISLESVRFCRELLREKPVSADGVILPQVPDNPALQSFLEDVIKAVDGVPHPSGRLGVNQAELEEFMDEAARRLAWLSAAAQSGDIMVAGPDTVSLLETWEAAKPLLEDYYRLDAAVALDPAIAQEAAALASTAFRRVCGSGNPSDALILQTASAAALREAPLAVPTGDGCLRLAEIRNPLQRPLLEEIMTIAARLQGKKSRLDRLSRADYIRLDALFKPCRDWLAAEQGKRLAFLPADYLRQLGEQELVQSAKALIAERGAASLAAEELRTVERLLLYKQNLVRFLNNFVVFPYLYDPGTTAAFEAGSFIADGRRFTFSVQVQDVASHKISANYSRMYVLYLEVLVSGAASYKVAVPVTAGAQGRLYKGKHGLFREPDGTERDAIIIDILENPISVPETLGMPFRKAYKTVSARLEEMSRKAEDKLAKSAAERTDAAFTHELRPGQGGQAIAPAAASTAQPTAAASTPSSAQTTPAATMPSATGEALPRPTMAASHAGTRVTRQANAGAVGSLLAGGSIALAALGSSFAFISKTFSEMSLTAILITMGSLALAVLLPVLIAALSKLAARDLAPLLEASGLAMNRRIRLSRSQARNFTVTNRRIQKKRLEWKAKP